MHTDVSVLDDHWVLLLQDVSTKIMQFAQHGPRAMCVMSANGAISNVTLRQQSSSGGTVTYEVGPLEDTWICVPIFWTCNLGSQQFGSLFACSFFLY